ncbi:MAG: hypothetical protein DMG76_33800, partial [Acidobacteria bacterium]
RKRPTEKTSRKWLILKDAILVVLAQQQPKCRRKKKGGSKLPALQMQFSTKINISRITGKSK